MARLPVPPGGSDLRFAWPRTVEEDRAHLKRCGATVELGPVEPRGAQLEALAGVHLTYRRTEINGRHGLPKFDDDETWEDPIVGLGGRLQLTDRWESFAEGDIGGFHVGSDIIWSWTAGIGYGFELFGRASFIHAGYRMLYQDYKDGGFAWDVTYKGPVVGITIRF